MRRIFLFMGVFCILFTGIPVAQSETTDSITQWGITWHFDKNYEYGKFANGDYWVQGPVAIKSITPDFDGFNNGWEVNPLVSGKQGFQSGCKGDGFDPSLVPDLPYTSPSSGTISIVKTIPTGIARPCIKTAAVLTIVTSVPPGNGTLVFRPPYVGTDKPYYYVNNLKTDLLPSYLPVGSPTSLEYIADRFRKLRLDHKTGMVGGSLRPQDSMRDYQPKNSADIINAALRFMLNDKIEQKMPALIQYVQAGIDKVHTILLGQTWPPGGGHEPAHILPASFTATMLDIQAVKDVLNKATFFHASLCLSSSTRNGNYLWGTASDQFHYWGYIRGLGGSRSYRDPYGFIDGGKCGAEYQLITSQSHKGEALAAHLMPELKNAWPAADLLYATKYADRWVKSGTWAQPDPCAPYTAEGVYGVDYGPDPKNPGMCILDPDLKYYNSPTDFQCKEGKQCGRFPKKHGTNKDGGQYRSNFVAAMWDAYRYQQKPERPRPPTGLKLIQEKK